MFKLIENNTKQRLDNWKKLRKELETSNNPYNDVSDFFLSLPRVKVYTDPYNEKTWPTAWELIEENQYCPFNIILGIFYTLKLCQRFSNSISKITISIDTTSKSVYYLLYFDNFVYGFEHDAWISSDKLPKSLKHIKIYETNALL